MHALRSKFTLLCLLGLLLAGCGGHSPWSGKDPDNTGEIPSAPQNVTVNAGDGAVSLGWATPATTGGTSLTYNISISPSITTALITIDGNSALIRGLVNNTTYTFSVTASNGNGAGPAAPVQATPAKAASSYAAVTVDGESDGLAEPALLRASDGRVWLTYSAVKTDNSGQITNSATRIALSTDGGTSYARIVEVGTPGNAVNACPTCGTGTWQYRTAWLIEDSTDPNAARRFKLFAHKYFVDAGGAPKYEVGAIAMWTAASPDGTWSQAPQSLLGWGSALTASFNIHTLDSSLQDCTWVGEGSATIYNNGIDLALSCVQGITEFAQRKIVLLRSSDHLTTLAYVATLLQPADAITYIADSFSAPTLLPAAGTAPALLATPIDTNGNAMGCVVLPIADENTGKLFNISDAPVSIQTLIALNESSRCAWDRGLLSTGILMGDRAGSTFTLQATEKSL